MKRLIAKLITCVVAVSGAEAEGLSPGDLTLLVTRTVGSYRLPSASLVTSAERMADTGIAGVFMSDRRDDNYLVAIAPDILCQFSSRNLNEGDFDDDLAEEIGSLVLSLDSAGICRGIIHRDNNGSTHLFVMTDVTLRGREGVWVSARGRIPIQHLVRSKPIPKIAEAIIAQVDLPSSIITIGDERFAITPTPETAAVVVVPEIGVATNPLMLCSPSEAHPLFDSNDHEEPSEIAYRAVHGPYRYDPLAYFVCP